MRLPFIHTRAHTLPCVAPCWLLRAYHACDHGLLTNYLLPQVNLMLTFEDREAFHLRKTFNSNGGFRQSYLHVGDGAGQK